MKPKSRALARLFPYLLLLLGPGVAPLLPPSSILAPRSRLLADVRDLAGPSICCHQ